MDFRIFMERIVTVVSSVNPVVNKVVVIILMLLLGFILGRVVGRLILWIGRILGVDDQVRKLTHMHIPFLRFLATFVSVATYIITVILVLDQVHIVSFVLYALLGAVFLVFLLSSVLALMDFFPNILAGFSLKQKSLLHEGNVIRMDLLEGRIVKISLLQCQITLKNGDVVVVPYSVLAKHVLKIKKMPQTRVKG